MARSSFVSDSSYADREKKDEFVVHGQESA